MKKNLLTNLPEDVFINNILLSKVLPIKSLLSLRCVCKYLRNLITSPAFINMHFHQTINNNNNTLVLIKSTHRFDVFFSIKFKSDDDPCHPEVVEFVSPIEFPSIWGSCNGLVCLGKRDNVCLWNPFTKEYRVLPPPLPLTDIPIGISTKVSLDNIIVRSITYGFRYDRLLDDYKVIRCSEHLVRRYDYKHRIPIIEFQVYTLGTNTWRKISTDENPYMYVLSLESTVFVNGAFHWTMSLGSTEAQIVSFDIEKEVFRVIQAPLMAKFKQHISVFPVLQVLSGCLCVMEDDSSTGTVCNVWMMMDYGVQESWTKVFTILRRELSCYQMSRESIKLLRFCENGTEILMRSDNKILVYDLINNQARRVEFGEEFGNWDHMYESEIYIESLVSLNSGVYKGEMIIPSKTKRVNKQGWKGSNSTRLLGDMAWHYMQKENYYMAEQLYSKALSIEPDKNKQCNLAICLMNSGRIPEAKSLLQAVVNPSSVEQGIADSYIKSYNRAWKILTELESQSVLNYPPFPHHAPYQQHFFQPVYFQPAYPMFNGVYPVVSLDQYYQYPQQYYQHFNHQYHPHMFNPYTVNSYQGFDHHHPM